MPQHAAYIHESRRIWVGAALVCDPKRQLMFPTQQLSNPQLRTLLLLPEL